MYLVVEVRNALLCHEKIQDSVLEFIFKAYLHWRFFKLEASDFQWKLVYSIVLFTLAIFQQFSEARKKLLAFKWLLYPFKQAIFVSKHIKYKNHLEK